MFLIDFLLRGSLLSSERLLQAREYYAPSKAVLPLPSQMARWTDRVAVQAELGGAREMAGLSDAELAALEDEFARCPARPRSDRARHANPAGALLAAVGIAGLAWQSLVWGGQGSHSIGQSLSTACLLVGAIVFGFGLLAAFGAMHRDASYGVVGLYVGTLDEQHPWLYRAMKLTQNPAAEHYRRRVLRDRGALRGMDYVLMQEIVRTHDSAAQIRPARDVAKQFQKQAPVDERRSGEPRLLRMAAGQDLRPHGVEEYSDARQNAMLVAVNDETG